MADVVPGTQNKAVREVDGGREYFTPIVQVGGGAVGAVDDSSYGGTGDATMIALLKAIYDQNQAIIAHLAQIEANTSNP